MFTIQMTDTRWPCSRTLPGQAFREAAEERGVAVVAASVGAAGVLRGVGALAFEPLFDGEGVELGAHEDRGAGGGAAVEGDEAVAADGGPELVGFVREDPIGHALCRGRFLLRHFGVAMQFSSEGRPVGVAAHDLVQRISRYLFSNPSRS